jgi:tRNA (mo5U34)-methyltransferase
LASYYDSLRARWPRSAWLNTLCDSADRLFETCRHGDLPRWQSALASLPAVTQAASLDRSAPELGLEMAEPDMVRRHLMALHPWRKGPLRLAGIHIDSEWRSDWKWRRVAPHVNLSGHRVLDIGCGNGYFGLRMLGAGANLVVGIDPTLLFVMQWLACRHFSGDLPNHVLPLGIEQLPDLPVAFDTVFSMGVLYHRRDHGHHLRRLHSLLDDDGTLVLETLVLPPHQDEEVLVPAARYARMRNVWAVPGSSRLLRWVETAGFRQCELVDVTVCSTREQRSTDWMRFESLAQALDSANPARTIEGHPAPARAVVIARK